jgi:hypothetical protein
MGPSKGEVMAMVAVFGNLRPEDDLTHPPGPEPNYNESAYYNFFDREQGLGGFVRIGNRVNEGYAEVTLCLFLPQGDAVFNYLRPPISSNDAFAAGGMRFEVLEPFRRHRTTYEGWAIYLADPRALADPGQAFRTSPRVEVHLDLVHDAIGPVYGTTAAERDVQDLERAFARAHYEQHMRATGVLVIDGQEHRLQALGLRDHSWGPRYWQAIPWYRWLTCSFGEDLGIMVNVTCRPDGSLARHAVVVRGPELLQRTDQVELESHHEEGTRYHRGMRATIHLEGEVIRLEGTVRGFVPLRNRRAGHVTHIGEAMTEYRWGQLVGLGISEYLDQIQ